MDLSVSDFTLLKGPESDPAQVIDVIARVVGERPTLQIDLTDPPSPVIARVGELEVEAASADEAIRLLGSSVADLAQEEP